MTEPAYKEKWRSRLFAWTASLINLKKPPKIYGCMCMKKFSDSGCVVVFSVAVN